MYWGIARTLPQSVYCISLISNPVYKRHIAYTRTSSTSTSMRRLTTCPREHTPSHLYSSQPQTISRKKHYTNGDNENRSMYIFSEELFCLISGRQIAFGWCIISELEGENGMSLNDVTLTDVTCHRFMSKYANIINGSLSRYADKYSILFIPPTRLNLAYVLLSRNEQRNTIKRH